MKYSQFSRSLPFFFIGCVALPVLAENSRDIEVITIKPQYPNAALEHQQAIANPIIADSAEWLSSVPGAAVNKNGPVSGIAQYRGLYGDRVSVKLDGHNIIGSGPNAMDAPMSYVVPNMIESMMVYRGIAPVSTGIDTLGGAVEIKQRQPEFADAKTLQTSGNILLGYDTQGDATTVSSVVNVGTKHHALLAYFNQQQADHIKDAESREIRPTEYDKTQAGIHYQVQSGTNQFGLSYHNTDTNDSGTPALAMDIKFIEADRFDLSGQHQFSGWDVDWTLGYLSSDHGMDNFSLRENMMGNMHRFNNAVADTLDMKVAVARAFANADITMGLDGYWSEHDSTITNPNNAMFNIANFNGVKDDRVSAFVEMGQSFLQGTATYGLRIKHNAADADAVSHHMAQGMMANANIATLLNNFNQSNHSVTETNYDLAFNWNRSISEHSNVILGAAVKQRAPSYQERYLWIPMQATGGLADGRTYIGDIALDSETAKQLNVGLAWQNHRVSVTPNLFYQKIDDYIQATPSTNMAANMVANMMTGKMPLQFANLDAKLFGMDVNYHAALTQQLRVYGTLSMVRGERTDIDDNLYRVAPDNFSAFVTYTTGNLSSTLGLLMFAKQDKVSAINEESVSAGYGVVDFHISYDWNGLNMQLGIDNLFDKQYAPHLAGVNRVMESDIMPGEKIPAAGRSAFLNMLYQF